MKKFPIVLSVVCVLAAGVANGQSRSLSAPISSAETWITRKWTATDTPYKDAEARIKSNLASGKSPSAVALVCRSEAQLHPSDTVTQFAAIYAERAAYVATHPGAGVPKAMVYELQKVDPGNVHELARCHFCMIQEAGLILPLADVKAIGERLLRYNSKDAWVRRSFITLLGNFKAGVSMALPYAKEWTEQEPSNAVAHSTLADAYFNAWEVSDRKSRLYGDKAVAEYQEYLRLAPPEASFRKPAQRFIKYIQEAEAG